MSEGLLPTEIIKPDLVTGFAALAPMVTAACAHMEHGDTERAMKILKEACRAIEMATMLVMVLPERTLSEPNND